MPTKSQAKIGSLAPIPLNLLSLLAMELICPNVHPHPICKHVKKKGQNNPKTKINPFMTKLAMTVCEVWILHGCTQLLPSWTFVIMRV
jgi:hypothetical protein